MAAGDLADALFYSTVAWALGVAFAVRSAPRELVALCGRAAMSSSRFIRIACACLASIVFLLWPIGLPLMIALRILLCGIRAARRSPSSPVLLVIPVVRALSRRRGAR